MSRKADTKSDQAVQTGHVGGPQDAEIFTGVVVELPHASAFGAMCS
jgi:hypothetical protein